ncbi:calcineurin-like phosphoesterase C-terminal domain-containing protein, partial [Pedobacter sp.]
NGVYYLPSNKTKNFVFISIPSGYEVESKNNILPAFYKNFSANAQTVEYADFELKAVDNNKHIMLALGDMHLANRNNDITQFQNGFLNDAKATIAKYKSEGYKVYGLTLGDMTWDTYWYDNNFGLTDYVNTMRPIDIPIFHTMGNHDNNPYIADDWNAENAFRGNLGPTYYSFNIGKVHYIVLDDIQYLNTGGAQGTQGGRNYNGVIVADQLAWLQKDLDTLTDKNTTIVVSMHINLYNNPTLSGQTETSTPRLTGATSFINMFSSFNDVHVITGHTHYSFNYAYNAKLMEHNTTAICATWWWTGRNGYAGNQISKDGTPGGYEIWKFNGTTYQWRYKSIGYDENYQFRAYDLNKVHITAAKYASKANDTFAAKLPSFASPYDVANTNNEILVNVWNYDKNWTVEILENGAPLTVTRVRTKDPLHIISYEALRLNVNADPTEDFVSNLNAHFFKAKANSATTPITIKVTDRFGNVYTETMTRPKDLTTAMK